MALIECPECGKKISDKADICIGCGFPIKKYLEEEKMKQEESKKREEEEKRIREEEDEKIREQYWCRRCYKQNKIGADYCEFCGNRLTPYDVIKKNESAKPKVAETEQIGSELRTEKEFHGIYRYSMFGGKQEVHCPRCRSENCSYFTEQTYIPGKTKTRYTANLNPLRPFTLVNKKEKVVRKDEVRNIQKIMCNDCGYIFK